MTTSAPVFDLSFRRFVAVAGISLAAGLMAGCSGAGGIKSASASPIRGAPSKAEVQADKAIAKAETAVAVSPDSAATRAALGNAYLAAGRFASAATAYDDAMALGDNSGRTALSLALAKIGVGRQREAVALLDDWRAEIPASDLGLALALAGETSRGVAVLADAVRSGESSAKLRQNLAYAYALDGRWGEAKLMAAQDVPAEQLDKRLAFWALSMLPDRNVERVAALIGAPVRLIDPGQPEKLALKESPQEQQMAAQQAAPAPFAPARPLAAAAPVAELAPVAGVTSPASVPVVEANLAVQRQVAVPRVVPVQVAAAPLTGPTPKAKAVRARSLAVNTLVKPVANGSHYVQLGAFSSQQGARRAWGIYTRRDRGLAAYRMTITPTMVKGKPIWRVAAGGLSGRTAANSLCSQLKAGGGACFAYAGTVKAGPMKAAPMPGAPAAAGPQRARR